MNSGDIKRKKSKLIKEQLKYCFFMCITFISMILLMLKPLLPVIKDPSQLFAENQVSKLTWLFVFVVCIVGVAVLSYFRKRFDDLKPIKDKLKRQEEINKFNNY